MSKLLEDFSDFIIKNHINIYRVAEIVGKGEFQVAELKQCNPCQNSYSVSKFFTLTAIGILVDDGLLNADSRITDILRRYCPNGMSAKWHDATIETSICHRNGLPEGCLDIDCENSLLFGTDYLKYVLSISVGDRTKYAYTDADFYLLSLVVEEVTGKTLCAFLWDRLFYPLGFTEAAWSSCPMGHTVGATGLYIKTEDMVKLGALYLNNGVYLGKRILSEDWIHTVIDKEYLTPCFAHGYGHGGMCGQMLAVLPKHNRALAWHGYHFEGEAVSNWLTEYLGEELIIS